MRAITIYDYDANAIEAVAERNNMDAKELIEMFVDSLEEFCEDNGLKYQG